ncbi:hypothetical protein [Amycolatopsis sp. NPDC054798]
MLAFAAMLKKLYRRLPNRSMVSNAAILHVAQPTLSQYLNLARIPPAAFLETIHRAAAVRTPERELPCRLNELIELRRAAKESLPRATTGGQVANNAVVHTTSEGESAGKKDRRNGKACRLDRRNGKLAVPSEPDGDANQVGSPASSGPRLKPDPQESLPSATPTPTAADMISAALTSLRAQDYATVRALLEEAEPLLHRVTAVGSDVRWRLGRPAA